MMTREQRAARNAFPEMPEELFTLWLDGLIEEEGWPLEWRRVLLHRTVEYWQSLRWEERTIDLTRARITAETRRSVSQLAKPPSGEVRQLVASSAKAGKLPGKLIFIEAFLGKHAPTPLELVDGRKRFAAHSYWWRRKPLERDAISPKVTAWVGCPPPLRPFGLGKKGPRPRRKKRSGAPR